MHGFSRRRSCLTNLLSSLDKVIEWIENGDCSDVIYNDFAETLDNVS